MLLRGITVDKKEIFFSINDKPLKVTEDRVVLTQEQNSPIVTARSISRGSSEHNFYEGDLVLDAKDKRLGVVVYLKGFKLYKTGTKEVVELPPIEDVKFVRGNRIIKIAAENGIPNALWVYKNMELTIDSFLVFEKKKAVLKSNGYQSVPLNQIKLSTGISRNGKIIAFGDTCCGGTVVLHGYSPMIQKLDNTYVELKEA